MQISKINKKIENNEYVSETQANKYLRYHGLTATVSDRNKEIWIIDEPRGVIYNPNKIFVYYEDEEDA